ncbi:MAG: YCF48-related protein, partial [bacterium]
MRKILFVSLPVALVCLPFLWWGCGGGDDDGEPPPPPPLEAPSELRITASTNTSISMQWTDNSADEDSFYIERSVGGNVSFAPLQQVGQNVTSFTNLGLTQGTIYYYRLRAGEPGRFSDWSNEAGAVAVQNTPPNAPSAPFPSDGATNLPVAFTLTWQCSDPEGHTLTYEVFLGTSSPPPLVASGLLVKSLSRTDLAPNTLHYWQVRARDQHLMETLSPVWQFTTGAGGPSIAVTSPNGGEVWAANSVQTISWMSYQIVGDVQILLSRDAGNNWPETITAATANDGSFDWTCAGPPGTSCRVRIVSVTNPSVFDESDGNFTITPPIGWSALSSGTTTNLNGVSFADAQSGWAVGASGKILHTTDGGQTWETQTSGTTVSLQEVEFISASLGWVVGNSGTILHTTNGGAGWSPQTSGTTRNLYGLDFVDAQNGWASGVDGLVLCTRDGGATWTPKTPPGGAEVLYSVAFTSATSGATVGKETWATMVLFQTTNGGTDWSRHAWMGTGLYGVAFGDTSKGVTVGVSGSYIYTTDGGRNWNPAISPT